MKQKWPDEFVSDGIGDGKWVVELFNENERSFHGHTVLAITGPLDGERTWTQTYDFLGGERYQGGPTSVEYAPLDPKVGKQWVHLSGFDAGRGFPDVVLSSRENVGYRQIGTDEAITGRRRSLQPSGFNYQVPGFVRFRAPHGHDRGPVLYGTNVRNDQWAVTPEVGSKLQQVIAESAQNPPPYAALWDLENWRDPNRRAAHNCHSWAKAVLNQAGLQVAISVAGPAPAVELNYFCYTCGLVLMGGLLYLVGRGE